MSSATDRPCPLCNGIGVNRFGHCPCLCNGTGRVVEDAAVEQQLGMFDDEEIKNG